MGKQIKYEWTCENAKCGDWHKEVVSEPGDEDELVCDRCGEFLKRGRVRSSVKEMCEFVGMTMKVIPLVGRELAARRAKWGIEGDSHVEVILKTGIRSGRRQLKTPYSFGTAIPQVTIEDVVESLLLDAIYEGDLVSKKEKERIKRFFGEYFEEFLQAAEA